MVTLLGRLFIKDRDLSSAKVRSAYGTLCSILGIFLNILLATAKMIAGSLSGSVAISADAVNNLSDAGSSVISLIGFRMSGKKADSDHPFGHGRMEYISGVIVSVVIIFMGIELLKDAISKIITPQPMTVNATVVAILLLSVFIKLYMAFYNGRVGKKIGSSSLLAVKYDSLSDSVATSVVLISTLVGGYSKIAIDGWAGAAVSLFVIWAGIKSMKDTISPLLGQPADEKLADRVKEIVMAHSVSHGIHDLVIHDYGVGRLMISLHVEVDGTGDIFKLHDEIDNIENELAKELSCEAVIHMDPIALYDENRNRLKDLVAAFVTGIDERLHIHDFRIVPGPTHTNMIFDVVKPFELQMTDEELKNRICSGISVLEDGKYRAVVTIDKEYIK